MYGDQFGEFVCGYRGLKVNSRNARKEERTLTYAQLNPFTARLFDRVL